ncbi:hypothetical protein BDR26DRAFT_861920 [Obelidium mucronatum]|nr:hypothetical protein BDR26DRAFT_861920 [Obelidium mucronatum]
MENATTEWGPWQAYVDAQYVFYLEDGWITVVASVVQLFLLLSLILNEGRNFASSGLTSKTTSLRKTIFKPINIILLSMVLCNLGSAIGNLIWVQFGRDDSYNLLTQIVSVVTVTLGGLFQLLVMVNTWHRGRHVVNVVFPRSACLLRMILPFYAILQIIQIIATGIYMITGDLKIQSLVGTIIYAVSIAAAASMLLFDIFFIAVFSIYLNRIKLEGLNLDTKRLAVVSQYGIASVVCVQITLAANIVINQIWLETAPQLDMNLWYALYHVLDLTPLAYISLQFAMKLALLKEKSREQNARVEVVENAKRISKQKETFSGRSS